MQKINITCALIKIALTGALLTLAACAGACQRSTPATNSQANVSNTASSTNANASSVGITDPAEINREIEQLEREAEKNPGDDAARDALSRAYLQRGNLLRDAQKYPDALKDYQRALRNDPDNEEAQQNIAAISPLVEGTPTAENGEPAPLPITPNVTDEGETNPTPAKTPKKP